MKRKSVKSTTKQYCMSNDHISRVMEGMIRRGVSVVFHNRAIVAYRPISTRQELKYAERWANELLKMSSWNPQRPAFLFIAWQINDSGDKHATAIAFFRDEARLEYFDPNGDRAPNRFQNVFKQLLTILVREIGRPIEYVSIRRSKPLCNRMFKGNCGALTLYFIENRNVYPLEMTNSFFDSIAQDCSDRLTIGINTALHSNQPILGPPEQFVTQLRPSRRK